VPRAEDPETLALLSAFLDGELSAAQEQDLIQQLEQRPELQDALDILAADIALTQRALADDAASLDGDVLATVLAALPAADVPATADGAFALASLVVDGEASAAQGARLNTLIDTDDAAAQGALETLAFVDATRVAAAAPSAAVAVAATLERIPAHVQARIERTERGYALAAAAVDAELSPAEADELVGLVGADVDLLGVLEGTMAGHAADVAIAEAVVAFSSSSVVARLGERAGNAALQVIAADAARAVAAPAATVSVPAAPSVFASFWQGLRAVVTQGLVPLGAAGAVAIMFIAIGNRVPDVAGADRGDRLAAARTALIEALEPLALAQNRALDIDDLPVIGDNDADVEAIDATGTTIVFQTPASNITVIWLAELEESGDVAGEQGT